MNQSGKVLKHASNTFFLELVSRSHAIEVILDAGKEWNKLESSYNLLGNSLAT